MTKLNLITLPKATILYVALLLLVVLPAISIVVFSNVLVDAWCKQFEHPSVRESAWLPDGLGPHRRPQRQHAHRHGLDLG